MVKPAVPSPLRHVVKASELQAQSDTVGQPNATSKTATDTPTTADASPLATNLNIGLPQVFAPESDPIAPTKPSTDKRPSPLSTSTIVVADADATNRNYLNVSTADTTSTQEDNERPAQDPAIQLPINPISSSTNQLPGSDEKELTTYNTGRNGRMIVPVNQPVWRQANLTMRAGIANSDAETQRRIEVRRDYAYVESIVAAKSSFKEGAKDCMLSGAEAGEHQTGESEQGLWAGDTDFEEMLAIKGRVAEEAKTWKKAKEADEASKEAESKSDVFEW